MNRTMTMLSELTTLRLGGAADRMVECRDETALIDVVRETGAADRSLLLLAGGSNLVIADEGFSGPVARILTSGIQQHDRDGRAILHVAAGESWDALVERCVLAGLAGIECLSGIPGSVGATPIQNVGAYGQEVSETIDGVRVYDRQQQRVLELSPDACGFDYRSSVFKREPGRWVVLSVEFTLEHRPASKPIQYAELAKALDVDIGDTAPLADVRAAVLRLRRAKGMVLDPYDLDTVSAGSFFLNPILDGDEFALLVRRVQACLGVDVVPPAFPHPGDRIKTSAAWLIERAGFTRGYGDPDGIAISGKHTLALTNRGHGTTNQLLALAREITEEVWNRFGIQLTPEPVIVR